ncbi:MAG TPA: GAF domain-containing sensor histidine kinase [bacterium]|nr:GAF domain-containing sensor histidine kinase [bacterium]
MRRDARGGTPNPRREARHVRELRVLASIAEALNSAPDVERALARTLALVADLLGLRTGWVWLIDPESGRWYNAAAQHLPPYLREPVRMAGRSCWCIESFRDGELTPKNIDVIECSRLRPAVKRHATDLTRGLAYHASIPLYFQDTPLGIMNVTGPAWRRLTAEELRLLSTIAYQVGIAIERARLAEQGARLARAEERTRIAREIHDTLAQSLTAIALQLEGAARAVDANPERAKARVGRALDVARSGLEEARRSVLNLRAVPGGGTPLPEALAVLGRTLTAETGVRVHVRTTGARPVPQRLEPELFRIAQEALTNVGRHAHATEVEVTLSSTPRGIRLSISDNGKGFAPRAVPEGRLGLVGMRERAELLGGRLHVASAARRGATVTVSVPGTGRGVGRRS